MENYIELKDFIRKDISITNGYVYDLANSVVASGYPMRTTIEPHELTEGDLKRMKVLSLVPQGSGHNNFLCGIRVSFDLTIPRYMWTEAQRYHWFDIVSSQSTMHKLSSMTLDYSSFTEDTPAESIEILKKYQNKYNSSNTEENFLRMKAAVPEGLLLGARISTNYLQLRTIYSQRVKTPHKLKEWLMFGQWMRTLPYGSKMISYE